MRFSFMVTSWDGGQRMSNDRMEVSALNRVDLAAIPARVQTELCIDAIRMVQRLRDDPGYQDRFEKWLADQARKKV